MGASSLATRRAGPAPPTWEPQALITIGRHLEGSGSKHMLWFNLSFLHLFTFRDLDPLHFILVS